MSPLYILGYDLSYLVLILCEVLKLFTPYLIEGDPCIMKLPKAAKSDNLNELKQCLRMGVNPNVLDSVGYTSLHWAASKGHENIVEELMKYHVNTEIKVGKFRLTPLHMAAGEGHLKICQMLINSGANKHSLDVFRNTPMHWGAWFGHPSVVGYLMQQNANVLAKNRDGFTPSDMASLRNREDIVKLLSKSNNLM